VGDAGTRADEHDGVAGGRYTNRPGLVGQDDCIVVTVDMAELDIQAGDAVLQPVLLEDWFSTKVQA
jgi:hypothetical protein